MELELFLLIRFFNLLFEDKGKVLNLKTILSVPLD
jgi:hypothetical protein